MRIPHTLAALLLAALAACSSIAPGPGGRTGPGAARPTLESEQARLADLFRGTPVVFAMQGDGSLRVTVPLRYSFDHGRYAVKPPLAAVLDRIASSQRHEPTRFAVAAPPDPNTRAVRLASDRAASTRDYLVARGIEPTRFSITGLGDGEEVVLLVGDAVH